MLQTKLTDDELYVSSIGSMRLRLQELQKTDSETQELRKQGQEGYKKVDGVFHHQGPTFHALAHPDKANQLSSRRYSGVSFWHHKDPQAAGSEVLLANP